MRSFPTFLLSTTESNLVLCSCCEAVLTKFPCHAVSISSSRLRAAIGHPRSRMALWFNLLTTLLIEGTALAQSPAAVFDLTAQEHASVSLNPDNVLEPVAFRSV